MDEKRNCGSLQALIKLGHNMYDLGLACDGNPARVTQYPRDGSSGRVNQYTYSYDRSGNRLSKDNLLNSSLKEAYSYDALNRLVDFTCADGKTQGWNLDTFGEQRQRHHGRCDSESHMQQTTTM